MELQVEKRKSSIIIAFCTAFLFVFMITLININELNAPYVLNDEYGYWASGAYFAGYDWSGVFHDCLYYSYGYGFILALLLRIFPNTIIAYKAAIILNGVFLCASIVLLYQISAYYFKKSSAYLRIIVCTCVVLYSANITQANYTWPEVFLFFAFCLISLFVVRIYHNEGTWIDIILLAIVNIYSYMIHQRTLGILVSSCIFMLCMLITKKIKIKHFLVYIVITIGLFICHGNIKELVVDAVWLGGNSELARNDYGGQVDKIKYIFSTEGVFALLTSLCGKVYNMVVGSFGFVLVTLDLLFKDFFKEILNFIKEKKSLSIRLEKINFDKWFFLMVVASSVLIGAIFMVHPGTTTHLIYGRYTDNILGPFIMFGIFYLLESNVKVDRLFIKYLIVLFILGYGVYRAISYFGIYYRYTTVNNAAISTYFDGRTMSIWLGVIVTYLVLIMFMSISNRFKRNKIRYAFLVVLSCVWIYIGQYGYKVFSTNEWSQINPSVIQMVDEIKKLENETDINYDIYVYRGEDWTESQYGLATQFLMPNKKIKYIEKNEITELNSSNSLILSYVGMAIIDNTQIIYENDMYRIFVNCEIINEN